VFKEEIMRKYGLKSITSIHHIQENREKYMKANIFKTKQLPESMELNPWGSIRKIWNK
jgi:hypothetical protein